MPVGINQVRNISSRIFCAMLLILTQPSNQIRLTNVSLVRLKKGSTPPKNADPTSYLIPHFHHTVQLNSFIALDLIDPSGKKRFEIACYKNKILEYRSGAETDLDNVLQIHSVFLSVSKGQTAPTQDLAKAFGPKTSLDEIIMEILNKGEVQVGEKERHAQLDRVHHEVLDIVSGKLVDPKSQRPYTTGMIEKALDQLSSQGAQQHRQEEAGTSTGNSNSNSNSKGGEATTAAAAKPANGDEQGNNSNTAKAKSKELPTWTGVVATKSAKSQALEAMKALIAWQPIPVARARMRLRITCPTTILKQPVRSLPKKEPQEEGQPDGQGDNKVPGTVKDRILSYVEQIESQDKSGQEWEVVGFVEPGAFKGLGEFVGSETKGKGRVEVLDMAVVHEGD